MQRFRFDPRHPISFPEFFQEWCLSTYPEISFKYCKVLRSKELAPCTAKYEPKINQKWLQSPRESLITFKFPNGNHKTLSHHFCLGLPRINYGLILWAFFMIRGLPFYLCLNLKFWQYLGFLFPNSNPQWAHQEQLLNRVKNQKERTLSGD